MRSLILLCLGGALAAQTPAVDSAARLNRVGLSLDAARFARSAAGRAASADERCALDVEMLTALDRVGAFSVIGSELAAADSSCVGNPAYTARAADLARIRRNIELPALPASGFDFSFVDHFNALAGTLAAGREPTEADWRSFYLTPGYRFADRPDLRANMELAFRPALAARRDSILAKGGAAGYSVRWLMQGYQARAGLARWRDSVPFAAIAERAKRRALAFLPPGTDGPIPFVAFAIFTADGYSRGPEGVILDLPYATRSDLESFLAHEFHHSLNAPLSRMNREFSGTPEQSLMNALISVRNEGIADLIDKPYPIHHPDSVYQRTYNEDYARTPQVLHQIDSLMSIAADDSTQLRAVGQRVQSLLPYGSHPNGAYIARTVYETFGIDSLMPAIYRPFALLRTYASAEAKRGNPPPFSAKTMALLDAIERKHLLRDAR